MKRPDKEINALNGTLTRAVIEYIAYLEGWISATKETVATMAKPPALPSRPKPKSTFTALCSGCIHSRKIPAHEKSDIKYLIVCDEPTYGKGGNIVQQCRQMGPCGPEAALREAEHHE